MQETQREDALDPTTFPVTPRDASQPEEVGDGKFSRVLGAFYWNVVLTAQIALAAAPLVLVAALLRPDPGLAWIAVLAAVPLGPALSAGLYAVRAHYVDPDEPVTRAYWRGYRLNWRDALTISVPALGVAAVIAAVVSAGADAGIPGLLRGVLLGFGVLVVIGTLHALALATFFRFRTADLVQLGAYYLVARWRATLGLAVLVVAGAAVVLLVFNLAMVALAGLWVWFWYRLDAGLLRDAYGRFAGRPSSDAS